MNFTTVLTVFVLIGLSLVWINDPALAACASLPKPALVSPSNGEENVSEPTMLEVAVLVLPFVFPDCEHNETDWQVASSPSFDIPTIVTFAKNDSTSLQLASGLIRGGTEYWWRARIRDTASGTESEWTDAFSFTVRHICVGHSPELILPLDGEIVSPFVVVFKGILPFGAICPTDVLIELSISETPGFENSFSPWDNFAIGSEFEAPPVFPPGLAVYWRMRFHSQSSGVGRWSEIRSFTVEEELMLELCSGLTPTLVFPNQDAIVSSSVTFRGEIPSGAGANCPPDINIRLQVSPNSDFADPVYHGVGRAGTDIVLTDDLQGNRILLDAGQIYYWRMAWTGYTFEWSETRRFTVEDNEEVNPPPGGTAPNADFSFSPNNPTPGQTISFSDESTDADNNIVSWNWSFGDGNSSTQQNPSYTYGSDGTYNVTLEVTDSDGNTDSISQSITVAEADEAEPLSIEAAIASLDPATSSTTIQDSEIIRAIQMWITSQSVPGTGDQRIDDRKILELITIWITGASVN